jgi:hypothetical protein
MKTKILTLVLILACYVAKAGDNNLTPKTTEDTSNSKKGNSEINAKPANNVEEKSFTVGGHFYEKTPVYVNGKSLGFDAFMELISQRNDLKLFKYSYFEEKSLNAANPSKSNQEVTVYLVFKGNDFYIQLDNKNSQSLLKFFNVEDISIN